MLNLVDHSHAHCVHADNVVEGVLGVQGGEPDEPLNLLAGLMEPFHLPLIGLVNL